MNITPSLPSPQHLPPEQERRAVSAVQPSRRTADPAEGPHGQAAFYRAEAPQREELAERAGVLGGANTVQTTRVGRALAAYAEVADDERGELRRLLGFEAYA